MHAQKRIDEIEKGEWALRLGKGWIKVREIMYEDDLYPEWTLWGETTWGGTFVISGQPYDLVSVCDHHPHEDEGRPYLEQDVA